MKKSLLFCLSLFLLLAISCDRPFTMAGRVVDEATNTPIEDVEIVTSEYETIYSDASGHFKLNRFGPGTVSDKLEMLLSKDGYETKYFDLSNQHDLQNINLSIKPSNETLNLRYPQTYVKLLYWINLIFINLIVLFSLLFVLFSKVRYKWIWIALFLLVNFTLRINYINGAIDFSFLHLPFYLKHYLYYPFTIKIAFPISVIVFWTVYISNKNSIKI